MSIGAQEQKLWHKWSFFPMRKQNLFTQNNFIFEFNLVLLDCYFIYMESFDSFHLDLLCESYGQLYFLGN